MDKAANRKLRGLTMAQKEMLGLLARGPRDGITDPRTVIALSSLGYATRLRGVSQGWRITREGERVWAAMQAQEGP